MLNLMIPTLDDLQSTTYGVRTEYGVQLLFTIHWGQF